MSNSYRDLIAWQQAVELVTYIYGVTDSFPGTERFGLTSQSQRSAVSVAANIAEGQGRNSARDFYHFLGNAKASLVELETHLFIAANLHYITIKTRDEALRRTDRVLRLINGLMNALAQDFDSPRTSPAGSTRETRNEERETLARR
jgi:four helix bundle protein